MTAVHTQFHKSIDFKNQKVLFHEFEIPRHSMKVMVKFINFLWTYEGEDNVFNFLGKYESYGYVI
ncbi:hypothetical protein ACOSP7_009986 [Xanthoceras sorbifolium]